MYGFKNIKLYTEPETTLFHQEIDVIQAVVSRVLRHLQREYLSVTNELKGTFILDGQKFGEEAKCILRFDLPDGQNHRQFHRTYEKTSAEMAEESIDELLKMPTASRYTDGYADERVFLRKYICSCRDVRSGLWRDGELHAVNLNTTFGRFLLSCHCNLSIEASIAVMYAVVRAIAKMGKEDKILQDSASCCWRISEEYPLHSKVAASIVEEMFENTEQMSAMKVWRAWHEPANAAGELTLFFE